MCSSIMQYLDFNSLTLLFHTGTLLGIIIGSVVGGIILIIIIIIIVICLCKLKKRKRVSPEDEEHMIKKDRDDREGYENVELTTSNTHRSKGTKAMKRNRSTEEVEVDRLRSSDDERKTSLPGETSPRDDGKKSL